MRALKAARWREAGTKEASRLFDAVGRARFEGQPRCAASRERGIERFAARIRVNWAKGVRPRTMTKVRTGSGMRSVRRRIVELMPRGEVDDSRAGRAMPGGARPPAWDAGSRDRQRCKLAVPACARGRARGGSARGARPGGRQGSKSQSGGWQRSPWAEHGGASGE